jgi:hypothetical protein
MANLSCIPDELLLAIGVFLCSSSFYEKPIHLASLVLVCHRFSSLFTPLLYKHLTFFDIDNEFQGKEGHNDPLYLITRSILSRPVLATYTRSIRFIGLNIAPIGQQRFDLLLSYFKEITELTVYGLCYDYDYDLLCLNPLKSLRKLNVYALGPEIEFARLFWIPSLRELRIDSQEDQSILALPPGLLPGT